jgi:hypothetical protein
LSWSSEEEESAGYQKSPGSDASAEPATRIVMKKLIPANSARVRAKGTATYDGGTDAFSRAFVIVMGIFSNSR